MTYPTEEMQQQLGLKTLADFDRATYRAMVVALCFAHAQWLRGFGAPRGKLQFPQETIRILVGNRKAGPWVGGRLHARTRHPPGAPFCEKIPIQGARVLG